MKLNLSNLGIAVILIVFAFAIPCNAAQTLKVINNGSQLSVEVNGSQVSFDQPPIILNGRTMVPFRAIAEVLGATVEWDSASNKVTISGSKKVELIIGSTRAMVDGNEVTLDNPAAVVGGRTMVPLRFIGEALGAEVSYTPPPVQTVQPTSSDGLLPNEDKIQKELSQDDIKRLQSYPCRVYDLTEEKLNVFQGDFGKLPEYCPPIESYFKVMDILENDLFTVDYEKLKNPAYAEKYIKTYYSVKDDYFGTHRSDYESLAKIYISKCINDKYKIKANLIYSKDTVCENGFPVIRAKYIFYQESGKVQEVEEGSTLKKWYWEDVEILFTQQPKWHKPNDDYYVKYVNIRRLSKPQLYEF